MNLIQELPEPGSPTNALLGASLLGALSKIFEQFRDIPSGRFGSILYLYSSAEIKSQHYSAIIMNNKPSLIICFLKNGRVRNF